MAVNWSKLSLIDSYNYGSDSGGDYVTARYYCDAQNIGFRPRRGDSAPVAVGSTWLVDQSNADAISRYSYIISVVFRRFLTGTGSNLGRSYKSLKREYEVEMGMDDFHVTPEMMGVIKAESIPLNKPSGSTLTDTQWTTARTAAMISGSTEWAVAAVDTTDASQKHRSYVDWSTASPATKYAPSCPFNVLPAVKHIDRILPCLTATVTFYRDDNHGGLSTLGVFSGINGTIPTQFNLPDATVSGKWIATGQQVRKVLDQDGDTFYQISRTMRHVPEGLEPISGSSILWAGSTWSWPTWP